MASRRSGAIVEQRRQLGDQLRPALAGKVCSARLRRRLRRARSARSRGAPGGLGVAELLRDFRGERRGASAGALQPGRRPRSSSAAPRGRSVPRARRADLRAGWSATLASSPIAATTASALSASTARRAMNWASSGMLLAAGVLERERGIAAHQRLDGEPEELRQVVIVGVFAVRHQLARDRPAAGLRRSAAAPTRDRAGRPVSASSRARRRNVSSTGCDGVPSSVRSWTAQARMYSSRVVEDLDQRVRRPAAGHVQRPHRAQPPVRAGALDEQLAQLLRGRPGAACPPRRGPGG